MARAFLSMLPARCICSQNIRSVGVAERYSTTLLLDAAADCPWISTDTEGYRNALLFDLDHDDAYDLVDALPAHIRPWLVTDPHSGRSAAILFLAAPVLMTQDASRKAKAMADFAQRLLASALNATPLPHKALVKNPLGRVDALQGTLRRHSREPAAPVLWDAWQAARSGLLWLTTPGAGPVELGELVDALVDEHGEGADRLAEQRRVLHRAGDHDLSIIVGRNVTLHRALIRWASCTRTADGGAILAEATAINGRFAKPLDLAEVACVARSVTKTMNRGGRWSKPAGRDAKAGAGLDADARRALSGRATAAGVRNETDAKIEQAVARLRAEGAKVTQKAVAQAVGVHVNTVAKRWSLLSAPATEVAQASALCAVHNTQDGCHTGSARAGARSPGVVGHGGRGASRPAARRVLRAPGAAALAAGRGPEPPLSRVRPPDRLAVGLLVGWWDHRTRLGVGGSSP